MKEKPILFSGPMVRAILDGRKTQTRRVVKPQPVFCRKIGEDDSVTAGWKIDSEWLINIGPEGLVERFCPYPPGTVLWVRETFVRVECLGGVKTDDVVYRANLVDRRGHVWPSIAEDPDGVKWTPSIFMPRWASRLRLLVTAVRVERLQDITEEDAEAEGVNHIDDDLKQDAARSALACGSVRCTARDYFRILWDSMNAKFGYGWDTNPWVWVYTFKVVS